MNKSRAPWQTVSGCNVILRALPQSCKPTEQRVVRVFGTPFSLMSRVSSAKADGRNPWRTSRALEQRTDRTRPWPRKSARGNRSREREEQVPRRSSRVWRTSRAGPSVWTSSDAFIPTNEDIRLFRHLSIAHDYLTADAMEQYHWTNPVSLRKDTRYCPLTKNKMETTSRPAPPKGLPPPQTLLRTSTQRQRRAAESVTPSRSFHDISRPIDNRSFVVVWLMCRITSVLWQVRTTIAILVCHCIVLPVHFPCWLTTFVS